MVMEVLIILIGGPESSFRLFLLTQRGEVYSLGLQFKIIIRLGIRLEKSFVRFATDCVPLTRPTRTVVYDKEQMTCGGSIHGMKANVHLETTKIN